jgi:steroid delta-isomerase-like uncharacterized protein
MSQHDNSQISRKVWEAWNAHDADRYVKLLDEKYVLESDTVPEPVRGREAARRFMEMYVKAFPDLHFTIDQMISTGDYVVTRYTATGTHRGELMGIPATNRRVETHGCVVGEIKNGKLVHDRLYWDTGHMLRQLGVLPAPAQAPAPR